jgi:regulator of sigma E protease
MNTLIGIVLVLGVIILVHEWGHFIVARLFGVRVDVFSIGFGPRLFGVKRGDTDWRVSALPLGGYVRMAGQDMSDVDSGDKPPTGAPDELMSKKRWQRALISFAGPAVNLIFPVLLLGIYYLVSGVPYAAFLNKPVVVSGFPSTQQDSSGLQVGDKLVALNDVKNPSWERAQSILYQSAPGTTFKAEIENNGAQREVNLAVKNDPYQLPLGFRPIPPAIGEVAPGTPADHAGVQSGDVVRSVNGQSVAYWDQFVDLVRNSGGKTLQLQIERKGQPVNLSITPKQGVTDPSEKNYQIGVVPEPGLAYRRVGPVEALSTATSRTADFVTQTVAVVGKLFSGKVSVKQLQSVVGISRTAGQAVSEGAFAVITFMALISVNLGILNLLPIPILDGGHILLLSLEGIRRRDFSLAFKERFIQVGLVFLLVLIVYVMYNDVMRMLPTHS